MKKLYYRLKEILYQEKGIAILGIMFVTLTTGMISFLLLTSTTGESSLAEKNFRKAQAFFVTESALNDVAWNLTTGSNWDNNIWSNVKTMTTPVGSANAGVDIDEDTGTADVTVTGTYKAQQRQIQAYIRNRTYPIDPFQNAACGCSDVNIGGNSFIDSYDSSQGVYGGGNVSQSGDVGCNGDVSLGPATIIGGNIMAGGNLSGGSNSEVSGNVALGGNTGGMLGTVWGGLSENVIPPPTPCNCGMDVDSAVSAAAAVNDNNQMDSSYLTGTDFSIAGNKTTTISNGTYYFTSFEVGGKAMVTVDTSGGDVIIYLTGPGPFNFAGNGLVNTSDKATNLKIYSNTNTQIDLAGNGDFAGTVYAPYSAVNVTGNGEIYGSIVADTPNFSGNGGMHYDSNLDDAVDPVQEGWANPPELSLVHWQENAL